MVCIYLLPSSLTSEERRIRLRGNMSHNSIVRPRIVDDSELKRERVINDHVNTQQLFLSSAVLTQFDRNVTQLFYYFIN